MQDTDRSELAKRLRGLPAQLALAVMNATAILVTNGLLRLGNCQPPQPRQLPGGPST